MNRRSEFAGASLEEQKTKIRRGVARLHEHGIEPRVFVAPAHTFDENTLRALRSESDIRVVSDTIASGIYYEDGFFFIPQQCGLARRLPLKLVTFCYHPNIATEGQIQDLESFLEKHGREFTSFDELVFNARQMKRTLFDKVLRALYFSVRGCRSLVGWGRR